MKRNNLRSFWLGISLAAVMSIPASAITFDLDCVLSGSACTLSGYSFGKVYIVDGSGGVDVTVVTATGGKYKDLYLNLDVIPVLTAPAVYSAAYFTLSPYDGKFDVGTNLDPTKGFNGISGGTFSILGTVDGTPINASNFNAWDSLGFSKVAIHLQELDCNGTGCVPGGGSIKVGGRLFQPPLDDGPGVPEPATFGIVGGGLAGLYWMRRKR